MSIMLERERALGALTAALGSATAGHGRLVLLSGEAGAGRSTLIDHFTDVARRSGARVVTGHCEALRTPRPLALLSDVVSGLRSAAGEAAAAAVAGAGTHELFDTALAALGGERVTVLIIEDAHWADEDTLDLVRYLSRRIAGLRVVLIASFRGDELGWTHPLAILLGDLASNKAVLRVDVDRLSRDAVTTLAAAHGVDADELYLLTDGNPFYVNEMLSGVDGGVPAGVRAAVRGRMARLSRRASAALEAVAVIGSPVRLDLPQNLATAASNALAEAIEGGLLRSEGTLIGFQRELDRLAVLDTVPAFRRATLLSYADAERVALLNAASSEHFLTGDLGSAVDYSRLALARAHVAVVEHGVLGHDSHSARPRGAEVIAAEQEIETWTRFFNVVAGLADNDEGWLKLAEIRGQAMASGRTEQAARMAVAESCLATFRLDPIRAVPLLNTAVPLFAGRRMSDCLRGCRAYANLLGGRWDEAEREAGSVLAEPTLPALLRVVPRATLGLLRARRGHGPVPPTPNDARSPLEPGLMRLDLTRAALVEAAWLRGDNDRAIGVALHALAEPARATDPWQVGALACWVYRAGGSVPDVAVAQPFALELAGDWASAAEAFERRGLPYEAALARLGGDVGAVRRALAAFTALGAEAAARRARHRLRELGARRGTRAPRHTTRANAFGLTARQLEIAGLLGEGLTNAQIAARLVISHNTVNHHVAAIFAKLNVRSREHAARLVAHLTTYLDPQ